MPTFSAGQLIGKTFFVTRPLEFYRVQDINEKGYEAKPVSNKLKRGYTFVMDSFLLPTQPFVNYGIHYARRDDTYFTFFGNDKKYYAVIHKPDGRFSLSKLKEQGAQTDQEILIKEQQEAAAAESNPLSNLFTSLGKTAKTVLFIGVGIFAAGYLLPKFLKK